MTKKEYKAILWNKLPFTALNSGAVIFGAYAIYKAITKGMPN